jgi:hypothetical protein
MGSTLKSRKKMPFWWGAKIWMEATGKCRLSKTSVNWPERHRSQDFEGQRSKPMAAKITGNGNWGLLDRCSDR